MVGWFGDAASNLGGGHRKLFMQMVTLIITSLAMGTTVTIGQHIGEKKPEEAGTPSERRFCCLRLWASHSPSFWKSSPGLWQASCRFPPNPFDKTVLYIRICSGGILVIIAYNVISCILRGVGNANLPFLFVGIAAW